MNIGELIEELKDYPQELLISRNKSDGEIVIRIRPNKDCYEPYRDKNASLQALAMYEASSNFYTSDV